jgi:hypothetical protein
MLTVPCEAVAHVCLGHEVPRLPSTQRGSKVPDSGHEGALPAPPLSAISDILHCRTTGAF